MAGDNRFSFLCDPTFKSILHSNSNDPFKFNYTSGTGTYYFVFPTKQTFSSFDFSFEIKTVLPTADRDKTTRRRVTVPRGELGPLLDGGENRGSRKTRNETRHNVAPRPDRTPVPRKRRVRTRRPRFCPPDRIRLSCFRTRGFRPKRLNAPRRLRSSEISRMIPLAVLRRRARNARRGDERPRATHY